MNKVSILNRLPHVGYCLLFVLLGGPLGLHKESGLAAIEAENLISKLSKFLHPEDGALRIADPTYTIFHDEGLDLSPSQGTRPEADRTPLRTLLDSILHKTIHRGHINQKSRTYHLIFENNQRQRGVISR